MKKLIRFVTVAILVASLLLLGVLNVGANDVLLSNRPADTTSDLGVADGSLAMNCKSAVLMDAATGAVLYAQNADEALPPASVTKIMTLLLVMEAIDSGVIHLDDVVSVSANAASMGGSQVYLKEGEQMVLEDLLKSVVIASANDAAVALAEYVCGSVEAFVTKMNEKAQKLGMSSTVFENVTGLDDTAEQHLTSARDIAIMSRALVAYPDILKYSSIWMDTIRNGKFGLTNTNRLVRFYRGCTGLKTGSTSKAGFCVSVTAERDGLSLICVIMGAESRDVRNAEATELLDWGFANYGTYCAQEGRTEPISVCGGSQPSCVGSYQGFSKVLPKGEVNSVEQRIELAENLTAPIQKGEKIGRVYYVCGNRTVGEVDIIAEEAVSRINLFEILQRLFAKFLLI